MARRPRINGCDTGWNQIFESPELGHPARRAAQKADLEASQDCHSPRGGKGTELGLTNLLGEPVTLRATNKFHQLEKQFETTKMTLSHL